MLRRSLLELSSRRQSIRRIPRKITTQHVPLFLSSRKEFSTSFQKNASPNGGPNDKSERRGSLLVKSLGAVLVVGTCYYAGWLDPIIELIDKKKQSYVNSGGDGIDHKDVKVEEVVSPMSEEANKLSHFIEEDAQKVKRESDLPSVETKEEKVEIHADVPHFESKHKVETPTDLPHVEADQKFETQTDQPHHETLSETESDNQSQVHHGAISVEERHEPEFSHHTGSEGSLGMGIPGLKTTKEPNEGIQVTQVQPQATGVPVESEIKTVPTQNVTTENRSEAAFSEHSGISSLLGSYHLDDNGEKNITTEGLGEQAIVSAIEELNDGYITKDGKLVLDFLEAIHAAEKRQAELDALTFSEEKRALKEKYEKELRDSRARELMCAEEAAMLDKEIKREIAKAAAAIKMLQERMEEKLRVELEQKENESEMKLQRFQELAKAELSGAIASEKAAHIEKIAEANLNGALALEDALSKGLPIQHELDALNAYLEGIDKDSLLHLVLSTLPEETRHHGTDTLLELNQKFNVMKGNLRHYILIPPGGDGILAHALAHVASWLRFKEVDPSGDGIESIISRVEDFLAEGKLAEAADALQKGVQGSQAEEIAGDWVRRARNRAIAEQALTVLQSHATCVGLTQ
ncbi:MICOS complex subunit MIC60 isoform X2 [Populus trichocarpa]|uniref:MICOS complex subunit MIC60 isoform X2 n=1 Tax=Populus trichocarpa TaxID=3694 RepID=UPI0022777C0D|nr:MICOS complex subunit MIC60 isoform X2 [Populus trichocarpa]